MRTLEKTLNPLNIRTKGLETRGLEDKDHPIHREAEVKKTRVPEYLLRTRTEVKRIRGQGGRVNRTRDKSYWTHPAH